MQCYLFFDNLVTDTKFIECHSVDCRDAVTTLHLMKCCSVSDLSFFAQNSYFFSFLIGSTPEFDHVDFSARSYKTFL
jgi:hypothetical protein